MAGRAVGQADWKPEDIERALAAWMKHGSAEQASKETGIPVRTIRCWRARHPERFADHCRRLARELQDLREETARDAAEGVREGVLICRQALRGNSAVDGKTVASLIKALSYVENSLDRISRLDAGNPTDIVEDRRTDNDLIGEIERALQDPSLRAAFEEHREAAA